MNMTVHRHSLIALDPRHFGRGRRYILGDLPRPVTSDEARLFVLTFAGGFLFTTIFLV